MLARFLALVKLKKPPPLGEILTQPNKLKGVYVVVIYLDAETVAIM
jgi:hypothetical protein